MSGDEDGYPKELHQSSWAETAGAGDEDRHPDELNQWWWVDEFAVPYAAEIAEDLSARNGCEISEDLVLLAIQPGNLEREGVIRDRGRGGLGARARKPRAPKGVREVPFQTTPRGNYAPVMAAFAVKKAKDEKSEVLPDTETQNTEWRQRQMRPPGEHSTYLREVQRQPPSAELLNAAFALRSKVLNVILERVKKGELLPDGNVDYEYIGEADPVWEKRVAAAFNMIFGYPPSHVWIGPLLDCVEAARMGILSQIANLPVAAAHIRQAAELVTGKPNPKSAPIPHPVTRQWIPSPKEILEDQHRFFATRWPGKPVLPQWVDQPAVVGWLIAKCGFDGGGGRGAASSKLSRKTLTRLLCDPAKLANAIEKTGRNEHGKERFRALAEQVRQHAGLR